MNRTTKCMLIALLVGIIVLPSGLAWAQAKTQDPPQKKAVEPKKDEPQEDYTEEEYNAFEAATQEPDLTKRAAMIVAFMEKYPKSKLQPNVTASYDALLYEIHKAGDYQKLETLAEQWLRHKPGDLKCQAYVFDAAVKLGQHQKVVDYGEKIYVQKPSAELASMIYNSYEKLGNAAKKSEWQLRLLELPEYNDNVDLRWSLVVEHAKKDDLVKASSYADQTLKALAIAKKPAAVSDAEWTKSTKSVEKGCYDIIGMNYYKQNKWAQAMASLQKAVEIEPYDAGYYYIAMCQWRREQVEEATDAFAIADLLGGSMSAQAKQHCLELYKSLHNGNDTGIDKVYRRAKAALEATKK
jgi:tetratricopeptide (TPR) repeat protein